MDLWDPFDNVFCSVGVVPSSSGDDTTAHVDWKETPEAHVFKADLPGVKVEVEDDDVLVISSQRNREKKDKGDRCHRVERNM
jgi:HSP20 family protein